MIRKSLFLLLLCCLLPSAVFAGKDEARKEIAALNEKVREAGEKGDLQAAITASEEVLEKSVEVYGKGSAEEAKALNNVANLYMFADHVVDAERLYKQAILIEADRFGTASVEIADSYFNLAMAYAVQKKYDEARDMLKKTLQIRTRKLGESHPDTKKVHEVMNQIWDEAPSLPG